MYSMALLGLVMSRGFMGEVLAADDAAPICSPDNPLIVEQAGVKVISLQGEVEGEEAKMMEAVAAVFGDSLIRVTNNSGDPLNVVIEFSGDEGFGVAEGVEGSFTLPGWSSKVVPLAFNPPQQASGEGDEEGEEFGVSHGYATLRIDSADYADYYTEVYLTGFSVTVPESGSWETPEESSVDPGVEQPTDGETSEQPAS